jgi:hypothetical protein
MWACSHFRHQPSIAGSQFLCTLLCKSFSAPLQCVILTPQLQVHKVALHMNQNLDEEQDYGDP